MRILITNDDGIRAEGIAVLARVARALGEVKVVAPDRERSACGHSMTMRDPLRLRPVDWTEVASAWGPWPEDHGIEAYEVNGVPVDCVNVGSAAVWPDGCDLILSGVNAGPNLGFDVTYSGTVAGAMEGAISGIRSIAVSMAVFVDGAPLHFATGERWLEEHLRELVAAPIPATTFLNVNIPAIDYQELRGVRVVPMGKRVYEDRVEQRADPWGRPYYWQGGVVVKDSASEGSDVQAVSDGFVSVTPLGLDWTDRDAESLLRREWARSSSKVDRR